MQFAFEYRDPQALRLCEVAEQRLRYVMRRAVSLHGSMEKCNA
jgi:hypothetical protein